MAAVAGHVAEGFGPARDVFAANFERQDAFRETGAALAAFHRGRCVLDLHGGSAGEHQDWTSETLVNVWSATKGVAACAVGKLVDDGAVRYEDNVASIWPEFAAAGKSSVTIAQLLSHQAGLNGFDEPTSLHDIYDWDLCCAKLAAQTPAWEPGTATSYHAVTFGWLVGEVVRRVAGVSLGDYLRDHVAGPLGADVFIGLPEALETRVAPISAPLASPPPLNASPIALRALVNPMIEATLPNGRAWRAAELPAVNGQASAMGLARLYAALSVGGALDGVRLMSKATIDRLSRPAAPEQPDLLMGYTGIWGMGVMCNPDGIYGPGQRAFGHSGWGGSFGCADPNLELSIGYVCGQMGSELIVDPRSVAISGAVTACAQAVS